MKKNRIKRKYKTFFCYFNLTNDILDIHGFLMKGT